MALIHNGKTPPFVPSPIRNGERKWYYGSWSRRLSDDEEITSSSWSAPVGMTVIDTVENVSCEDELNNDELVGKCNGVLIDSTLSSGEHYIKNTITTSEGETEISGFYLRARDFTTV
jgi:hypothetical protein